jgi:hypothetical protein
LSQAHCPAIMSFTEAFRAKARSREKGKGEK